MTDFNDPGTGGDRMPITELVGSLLLFTVNEETDPIATEYGESTAIQADVAVLDGALKGEVYAETLIFQRVLKSQLRGSIGGKVLGRLELGLKKPGKNAPYQLAAATEADREVGRKYLAYVATLVPAGPAKDEEPF